MTGFAPLSCDMNLTRVIVLGVTASVLVISGTSSAHVAECDVAANTVQPDASLGAVYLYQGGIWLESNAVAGLQDGSTWHQETNGGGTTSHQCANSDTRVQEITQLLE